MNIDSIERGLVIDHIKAGKGMEIVRLLGLEDCDNAIAVIRNARSGKSGRKDIIKVEDKTDVNLDVLGFIDPDITVNVISGGHITEKKRMTPPAKVTNVVKCKNPRCVSGTERGLAHVFLRHEGEKVYRCAYCEAAYGE
jgi:aspartate carbamoyltransferase regulatory subunit